VTVQKGAVNEFIEDYFTPLHTVPCYSVHEQIIKAVTIHTTNFTIEELMKKLVCHPNTMKFHDQPAMPEDTLNWCNSSRGWEDTHRQL